MVRGLSAVGTAAEAEVIAAVATAEPVAAMAEEVVATNAAGGLLPIGGYACGTGLLEPFQTVLPLVWNCLKLRFFLLHLLPPFNI